MDLRLHQRSKFNKYIVPLYKKTVCEDCGSAINLELHHEDRFIDSLRYTLKCLSLDEKDTEEYTNEELELITNVMLGIQLRQKYKTLCNKCHETEHEHRFDFVGRHGDYAIRAGDKLDKRIELVRPYIESMIGKRLVVEDKNKICEKFYIIDKKGQLFKWPRIKKIIIDMGYMITEKSGRIDGKVTKYSTIN